MHFLFFLIIFLLLFKSLQELEVVDGSYIENAIHNSMGDTSPIVGMVIFLFIYFFLFV